MDVTFNNAHFSSYCVTEVMHRACNLRMCPASDDAASLAISPNHVAINFAPSQYELNITPNKKNYEKITKL